jgi:hypothetical protein
MAQGRRPFLQTTRQLRLVVSGSAGEFEMPTQPPTAAQSLYPNLPSGAREPIKQKE